jgi:hypothetical protein
VIIRQAARLGEPPAGESHLYERTDT